MVDQLDVHSAQVMGAGLAGSLVWLSASEWGIQMDQGLELLMVELLEPKLVP